jgi:malate dehydrogenase (oxaloacetate-decarboxylating)(NADP+)
MSKALSYHKGGKIGTELTKKINNQEDLSLAYTPGVAEVCKEIVKDSKNIYKYTSKQNTIAVISDGTACLGLGNIGAGASLPVMEGKCMLFKRFANINAVPICLNIRNKEGRTDIDKVVDVVKSLAINYGGINLEDFAAPECFELEERLINELDIPVMHDDQWGTAIVVLAALINYSKIKNKNIFNLKVIINGAGAAGTRIYDTLKYYGISNLVLCDSKGAVSYDRKDLNKYKAERSGNVKGTLGEVIKSYSPDVFIGVSAANCLTKEMLKDFANHPAIFAMANPIPEIDPYLIKTNRPDAIYGTGRSDFPNQINNALAFPYLFGYALDNKLVSISMPIKIAYAEALAELARKKVPQTVLSAYGLLYLSFEENYIIPKVLDERLSLVSKSINKYLK